MWELLRLHDYSYNINSFLLQKCFQWLFYTVAMKDIECWAIKVLTNNVVVKKWNLMLENVSQPIETYNKILFSTFCYLLNALLKKESFGWSGWNFDKNS